MRWKTAFSGCARRSIAAVEVAAGIGRRPCGIERGDLLLAVNAPPVRTPAEVVEYQHTARPALA